MTDFLYKVADERLAEMIQCDLERFSCEWQKEETIGTREPIAAFCDVMIRGGKRLRGMLAMQSYFAHGGTNETVALGAARVFEILQTSLLVVDDIADRSELRRGGPSAHMLLQDFAKKNDMKIDSSHFGVSQAMNVAYAGLHKATTELLDLPIENRAARVACQRLHENILTTINGQIDDIFNEATNDEVSEEMVMQVLERKTPSYTILGPLELGAQLAGVELSSELRDYSLHAGVAYQIADDIISTFGHEMETGKGSNDDIREGKLTLLTYFALDHATTVQRSKLTKALGNPYATSEECDEVRETLTACGALDYAKERGILQEKKALAALDADTKTDATFLEYLRKFTDYIVNRRS